MGEVGSAMEKPLVFALHGFLGQGSDWDRLKDKLPEYEWFAPSYLHPDFENWSDFDSLIDVLIKNLQPNRKCIFLGYSLGGRIGLHLLKKYPQYFQKMIFLSTHYGLEDDEEKKHRIANDLQWLNQLRHLSWDQFISLWNQQPVFSGSEASQKASEDFKMTYLTSCLVKLSLGQQQAFKNEIENSLVPIHWITGSLDLKFTDLGRNLKASSQSNLKVYSIKKGHRLLEGDLSDLIELLKKIT